MKTFAVFYEANLPEDVEQLPKDVEQLPDGTYKKTSSGLIRYALDPQMTKLHRIDGPASISSNHEQWWLNGKRHRIDGPAVIDPDHEEWWLNGQLHRVDGPAFTQSHGRIRGVPYTQELWYQNGQLHRIDGPAVTDPDHEEWWLNDQLHRIGGPALVAHMRTEWWVEGVKFTEEDYNNLMKRLLTLTDASDKEATIAAATMFD